RGSVRARQVAQDEGIIEQGSILDELFGGELGIVLLFLRAAQEGLDDRGAHRSGIGIIPEAQKSIALANIAGRSAAPNNVKSGSRGELSGLQRSLRETTRSEKERGNEQRKRKGASETNAHRNRPSIAEKPRLCES